MSSAPSYVILGRGRWARKMEDILAREQRQVSLLEDTRGEVGKAIGRSGADIAWLCVPPGEHIYRMMQAAISAGLHVVVEKPWQCSRSQTDSLLALARAKHLMLAIHYEYCLLEAVQLWRRDFRNENKLRLGGRFTVSRPDHLGISALENLGSHLLAIRAYAVPNSETSEIDCGYDRPDERRVWIKKEDQMVGSIDFRGNQEPVIQRFIAGFEAAVTGADFPFDLDFAWRVSSDVKALNPR